MHCQCLNHFSHRLQFADIAQKESSVQTSEKKTVFMIENKTVLERLLTENTVLASDDGKQEDSQDFATGLLRRRKLENKNFRNYYSDASFEQPTSNILECFFSIAEFAFNGYKTNLLLMNLEKQLFLKVNHRF